MNLAAGRWWEGFWKGGIVGEANSQSQTCPAHSSAPSLQYLLRAGLAPPSAYSVRASSAARLPRARLLEHFSPAPPLPSPPPLGYLPPDPASSEAAPPHEPASSEAAPPSPASPWGRLLRGLPRPRLPLSPPRLRWLPQSPPPPTWPSSPEVAPPEIPLPRPASSEVACSGPASPKLDHSLNQPLLRGPMAPPPPVPACACAVWVSSPSQQAHLCACAPSLPSLPEPGCTAPPFCSFCVAPLLLFIQQCLINIRTINNN